MKSGTSRKLFDEACRHLVGGVNSPVRAFRSVGGTPPFIVRGKGSHLWDADGNEFIDYVCSWGAAILGHAPVNVLQAIHEAMKEGLSFGAPTAREIELAKLVKKAFSSIELVRFVSSGTEAVMSAIRLARGFTKRPKIIKFDGCYHGHADHLLVKAGSGAATLGTPDSAGVPEDFAHHTLVARYNDLDSVRSLFNKNGGEVACVIVEPVAANIGCIPPAASFLEGLRKITTEEGALLIFDEVITGFRVAFGGAQELYGVTPDLTTLGKIIGGGLPVGAYGGRAEIMEMVAPLGPVYQAGTLSGNPVAMAAGIATLITLDSGTIYTQIEKVAADLTGALGELFKKKKIPVAINRVGSIFSFFFSDKPVTDADSARKSDPEKFKKIFHALLAEGIYIAPSPFEAAFLGTAHSTEDIVRTLKAFERALG